MRSRRRVPQTVGNRRSAAAAVEFALILPVLLTMVWGCVDYGRFYHSYYSVINAARTGAGHAATHTATSDDTAWQAEIREAVIDEMDRLAGFDESQVVVTATRDFSGGPIPRLDVTVQYPFETVVDWPLLPSDFQLVHTSRMRAIR